MANVTLSVLGRETSFITHGQRDSCVLGRSPAKHPFIIGKVTLCVLDTSMDKQMCVVNCVIIGALLRHILASTHFSMCINTTMA